MCGTQHVLIGLLEEWGEQLDHNKIIGTVLLDLSKAFDCILHDLLIAKLNAYGFDKNTLTLLFFLFRKTEINLLGLKPITAHF